MLIEGFFVASMHGAAAASPSGAVATNALGQPIGPPVPNWTPCALPSRTPMQGRYCLVRPLDVDADAAPLWRHMSEDESGFTYNVHEYPRTLEAYTAYLRSTFGGSDPLCFVVVDPTLGPVGIASFLRIDAANGVLEVGWIHYAPALKRTRVATEAMYLMMRRAFELRNRRYEWKCDALNAASVRAALRLGFSFEGTFRQARVYKGRSRDTAWFSIVDTEWPRCKAALEAWLHPDNFGADGVQLRTLEQCRQ